MKNLLVLFCFFVFSLTFGVFGQGGSEDDDVLRLLGITTPAPVAVTPAPALAPAPVVKKDTVVTVVQISPYATGKRFLDWEEIYKESTLSPEICHAIAERLRDNNIQVWPRNFVYEVRRQNGWIVINVQPTGHNIMLKAEYQQPELVIGPENYAYQGIFGNPVFMQNGNVILPLLEDAGYYYPFASPTEAICVTRNGKFFNYKEITIFPSGIHAIEMPDGNWVFRE